MSCKIYNPLCENTGGGHYYVGKNAKIGFSFIISNDIHIGDIRIGHLNFIKVCSLNVDGNIGHLNIIKGNIRLDIQERSFMKNQNKITNNSKVTRDFVMMKRSSVISHHIFDVSDNITLREKSCIAGYGTQIWTHSFIFGSYESAMITAPVDIGRKVYIESASLITPGCAIVDNCVIGAKSTVSKNLNIEGLYVSQGLRYIPYDADTAINELKQKGKGFFFER